jgi:uncharacterized protein
LHRSRSVAIELYTDWLWFGETGCQTIFLRILTLRGVLGIVAMAVAFVVMLVNMRVAMRRFSPRQLIFTTREGPIAFAFDPRLARTASVVVAGVLAALLGLYASSRWLDWLFFLHGQPFGEADPVLGRDAGFYVFRLPLLAAFNGLLLVLVALTGIATAAVYALTGSLNFSVGRGLQIAVAAKQHLAILAAALLLLLAFGAHLDVPGILNSPGGIIHGATNVDVAIRIPALRVLMVTALIGAALSFYQAFSTPWWPIVTAATLYIVAAAGGSVAGALMQRFVIAPNEQVRETGFIEHNIAATRKAFALDQVEERELSGDALLSRADIDANDATLGNVRLWDHQPLLQTFGRIPELKRVILAHQNQIVMEETLDKTLDRLFPADGPGRRSQRVASLEIDERPDRPVPEYDTLTAQAVEHYRNAIQAQRDGNWGRYGDEIRRLGEVLEKMRPQ